MSGRALLTVDRLHKSFPGGRQSESNGVHAVDDVSLAVGEGELFTLLGPSGCGKTTTLRCIAGLEIPDSGEIVVDGRILFSSTSGVRVRTNDRNLGMVFQSYAIWPHMSVYENAAFPLEVAPRERRLTRAQARERVERTLSLVRLDGLEGRAATDLSGGQQQRLALARALVTEPPLLLLDEPLSSVDARLRAEMCLELARLQRALGVTTVYVTHDQEEALAMSSVIAVMDAGKIAQVGSPREIYAKPGSRFVADFVGASNLIDGVVEEQLNGSCVVRTAAGRLSTSVAGFAPGTRVVVAVRAEDLRLDRGTAPGEAANRWAGVVHTPAFRGDAVDHDVAVGDLWLRVRTEPSLAAAAGDAVTVTLPVDACVLLPADD